MLGENTGLPEINEADQTQRKIWRHYFVYRICYVIALATILFYSIAICVTDSTYSLAWIALLVTAPALVIQVLYLYRMRSILRY